MIALIELPVDGLMPSERAVVVPGKSARMMQAMRDCRCSLNNGYMQFRLLPLVVIPELHISDHRLVDVSRFAHNPFDHESHPTPSGMR